MTDQDAQELHVILTERIKDHLSEAAKHRIITQVRKAGFHRAVPPAVNTGEAGSARRPAGDAEAFEAKVERIGLAMWPYLWGQMTEQEKERDRLTIRRVLRAAGVVPPED